MVLAAKSWYVSKDRKDPNTWGRVKAICYSRDSTETEV